MTKPFEAKEEPTSGKAVPGGVTTAALPTNTPVSITETDSSTAPEENNTSRLAGDPRAVNEQQPPTKTEY